MFILLIIWAFLGVIVFFTTGAFTRGIGFYSDKRIDLTSLEKIIKAIACGPIVWLGFLILYFCGKVKDE